MFWLVDMYLYLKVSWQVKKCNTLRQVKKCNTLIEKHEDVCVKPLYDRNPLQS